MTLNATLGRYLARGYLVNFLVIFAGLLMVLYLFDTVELIRRASNKNLPLGLVFEMGLLKLPEVGQTLMPFAVLFSAMFTFWQLTRRYELVVVRAAGFSAWQFIAPLLLVALLAGVIQVSALNPLGAVLIGKFERLESRYLEREANQIALFKEGLWLHQNLENGESYILNARKIQQPHWILKTVSLVFFDPHDAFLRRLDAEDGRLERGVWRLRNIHIYNNDGTVSQAAALDIPTPLTAQKIEQSFSLPETMSFWNLPSYIRVLEETGFDAGKLRVHYYSLLSQPLLFMAMVLLAAAVCLRPPRQGGGAFLFASGVFGGFFIFFISSFLQALGASAQIPVALAAWAPALVTTLLGLTALMALEDG